MNITRLTKNQARRFILLRQGLLGGRRFRGKQGVCDFVRRAGCLQYDPIDVCGKNAELVLQSRVSGFTKEMLDSLLYHDRKLIDYFDKNMSIFCAEDWPLFARVRDHHRTHGYSHERIDMVADEIRQTIHQKEFTCSQELRMKETVDWSWSPTTLSRAALETLYFRGELMIHHKKGTVKYYALARELLPADLLCAPDPNGTDEAYRNHRVLRRIGAVGLLWDRPSDAFLGIDGLNGGGRTRAFEALAAEHKITACEVEGIADPLYCLSADEELLLSVLKGGRFKKRLEFIAPLDNMLWDRRLIQALFDFDYKWEIYTPAAQRKYSYYVLPVLYGSRFVGRAELVVHKKEKLLEVANFWPERWFRAGGAFDEDFEQALTRFARFNDCTDIVRRSVAE